MTGNDDASIRTPLLRQPFSHQPVRDPLTRNLWIDVGILAQIGVLALVISIWAAVISKPLILFSGHPLAQSLAVAVLTQAILILQPTHEAEQKRLGQRAHALINLTAFLLFVIGVTIIEVNKFRSNGPHWHSLHGILGILVSILILIQYLVGFTMWAIPALYGGTDNAKAIWKFHRASGYFIYVVLLATILSAVWTDYNKNVLGLAWWHILIIVVILLVGVLLRINVAKFGIGAGKQAQREEQENQPHPGAGENSENAASN